MLDNFYENIGGKIKSLAKGIFVVESIGAGIAGFSMLFIDGLILMGLLTLLFGPIIAWIGSWVLYGFGELIEKTADNESHTRKMLKKLNEKASKRMEEECHCEEKPSANEPTMPEANETSAENKKESAGIATFSTTENNTIICSQCKFEQPTGRKVCWHCGAAFKAE